MTFEIDLSNKVVIVTGAARGIGRAIALSLADAGAKVMVNDILFDELEKVVKAVKEKGGESHPHQADITIKDQVEGLIKETERIFGRIDVLVNNAGILRVSPFLETTEEDWDETMAVNLKGTLLCSQAAARQMIKQGGGKIINVASIAGRIPRTKNAAYCASKAAVIQLTRVMTLELAKFGITVNALCPGPTETEMMIEVQAKGDPRILARMVKGDLETFRCGIPMGRLAKPEEQAAMVVYLASDKADYITGQTFIVDGGQTMF